jgi:LssY-like putative type I secretion system component LssY
MLSYIWRFIKRFAVLIPGIIIAYLSVRDIFPYFSKRLPLIIAILATYALGAYVLIPAILRLWRIIVPANHLPLYCVTPDGYGSDPLNIGIIGSRTQLIDAMTAAGWHVADRRTPRNLFHGFLAIVFKLSYDAIPVSTLYLFGRKQDIGFEKLIDSQRRRGHRHHVRFWATTFSSVDSLSSKTIHWYDRRKQPNAQNLLWVGAASRDVGITFIKHTLQLTHMVVPDTNRERELIVGQLTTGDQADVLTTIQLVSPYKLVNRAWRGWHGYLLTDGKMTIIQLSS